MSDNKGSIQNEIDCHKLHSHKAVDQPALRANINRLFPLNGFAKNVLTLISGSVLAQIMAVAAAPILTRLYSPEEFGILALYTSIVTMISVVLCWKYERAIVLPEDDKDAANLLVLSIILAAAMTAVFTPIAIYFRKPLAGMLGMPELAPWFWAFPVSFIAMGLYQAFNLWSNRKKQFKRISISRIGLSSSTAGTQIGTGVFLNIGAAGLISGRITGDIVATFILGWQILRKNVRMILSSLSKKRMIDAAKRYKKYPIYSTWPGFFNNLTMSMPVLFITRFFDTGTVGQYSLAIRMIQMPLSLVGSAIGQVYFQRLAQKKNECDDISRFVEKTFLSLLLMAIPLCLVLMLTAPTIFEVIFGDKWRVAGEFSRILAPALSLRFVTSPLTPVFSVSNRQEVSAVWQIIAPILTGLFLLASLYFDHPMAMIYALVINDFLLYSIYLFLVFRIAKASFRRAFRIGV